MKYFIDTEFNSYNKKILFSQTNTIELISIGIVLENGKKLYLISKEFDIKKAWEDNFIRENVLYGIYKDLVNGDRKNEFTFTLKSMKYLISCVGLSRKKIKENIFEFIKENEGLNSSNIEFYGYYCAFDYVVFSLIFGSFEYYPKSFPMYFKDLKQELDSKVKNINFLHDVLFTGGEKRELSFNRKLEIVKSLPQYPKEINCHNSLKDAEFNLRLHNFLENFDKIDRKLF